MLSRDIQRKGPKKIRRSLCCALAALLCWIVLVLFVSLSERERRNESQPRYSSNQLPIDSAANRPATANALHSSIPCSSPEVETTATTSTPRLLRIRDEATLRRFHFFRIRDPASGLWLSRSLDTNAVTSSEKAKIFQFRFHSGKYQAWSIQSHTRKYLTSEMSDRVTVDRTWARGYEMWFLVFGSSSPSSVGDLRDFFSKRAKSNKNTQTTGDFLYLISRRNRKAVGVKKDTLWTQGDNQNPAAISPFELYAELESTCGPNSTRLANFSAPWAFSEADPAPEESKQGPRSQAILRANLCWGILPKANVSRTSTTRNLLSIPLFGSPKPPTQLEPANISDPFDGVLIARRTIRNWAMLDGMHPLFLVDNDLTESLVRSVESKINQDATKPRIRVDRNFEIHPSYRQPTYRGLFKAALRAYPNVPCVMYSNMDILYTRMLRATIEAALDFYEAHKMRAQQMNTNASTLKGWMIVGQRINYRVPANWTNSGKEWVSDIEERFARHGELFESDAEDYFIVSRDLFDWNSIPDFVVGGVAFDNWIVSLANAMAINGEAIVIDGTKTIVALHQNHGKNVKGSHRHPKSVYNSHLAAAHGGISMGHTTDTLFATEVGPDGIIRVYDKHRLLYS